MQKIILGLFLVVFASTHAQQTTAKSAFFKKWENSKEYLITIAEAMPEQDYNFKPTERQMSFKEQLLHIQNNMEWLSSTYFRGEKTESTPENISKQELIESLTVSFNAVAKAVSETPERELEDTVDFFAGPKSKLQILNLLQDHLTHHRGQLIVYLNLKNIEPPKYVGW